MTDFDPAWWPESYPRPTVEQIAEQGRLRAKWQTISKRVIGMVNTSEERRKRGIR